MREVLCRRLTAPVPMAANPVIAAIALIAAIASGCQTRATPSDAHHADRHDAQTTSLFDAGEAPPDAAESSGPAIELGTGPIGSFIELPMGSVARLQRGCQGSQHIFVSIRVRGIEEERPIITVRMTRVRDATHVSAPLMQRLPLEEVGSGWREITGLTPVVEDPRDVLDEVIRIDAEVQDSTLGLTLHASRDVSVRWGEDACRPHG